MRHPNKKSDKVIYFDGDCNLCRAVISSAPESFHKTDITQTDNLPQGVTQQQALSGIHVIDRTNGTVLKNSDAILEIVRHYRFGQLLYKIGHLPLISPILELTYRFVARHRYTFFNGQWKLFWTRAITSLGLLFGVLLFHNLWSGGSDFPRIPVFEGLPRPDILGYLLLPCISALLVLVITSRHWRMYIVAVLTVLTYVSLTDQSAFQPWVQMYGFILAALAIFNTKGVQENRSVLANIQLTIIAVYILSATFKFNPSYFAHTFEWIIEPLPFAANISGYALKMLATLSVMLELGIGILLLVRPWRKAGVILVTLMHLLLLHVLGPLGHNWDSSIWPWNVALIALVWLLFWGDGSSIVKNSWRSPALFVATLILFFLLPLMGHVGRWDRLASFALYTGNYTTAQVAYSESSVVPMGLRQADGSIHRWSFEQLNAPLLLEIRSYKSVFKILCRDNPNISMKLTYSRKITEYGSPRYSEVLTCLDTN